MSNFTQSLLPLSFPSDDKRPLPEIVADGKPDPDGWPAFPLAYKDVDGKRYYAIQDWIRGVAQPADASKFWDNMKRRLNKAGIEISTLWRELPYLTSNNKTHHRDYGQPELLYLITQHMHPYTGVRNAVLGIMSGFAHTPAHRLNTHTGYVYLISLLEAPQYVKIGKARDLKARVAQLDIVTPFTVVLKHSIYSDDCFALEKSLHKRYSDKHIKGEWFALTEVDIDAIRSLYSAKTA